jgi:hypothetical protein
MMIGHSGRSLGSKGVMKVLISTLALFVACALPAEAQLKLEISNGRVTLDANSVPARQILAEWARIGGTKVVGAEKVTGTPLTLKFVDMPEKQALDIILRNVAGFMAAPRLASSTPGASAYDRILIMATSSAPAPAPTARAGAQGGNFGNPMNGVQRRVPPRPPVMPPAGDEPPMEDDQGNPVVMEEQPAIEDDQQPVFSFPAPNGAPGNNPVFVPMPNNQFGGQAPGAVTAPVITLQPGTNGPTIYNFVPTEGGAQTPTQVPTGGFGVIGSPTPGMIQLPPPQSPGDPRVVPGQRPPGGGE